MLEPRSLRGTDFGWATLLLGAAFFLRLYLAPNTGFKADLAVNLQYGEQAVAHGVTSTPDLFTNNESEMLPPLFIYQDALVQRIAAARLARIRESYPEVAEVWERVRFKMLPIAYDLFTGLVILLVLSPLLPSPWPLFGCAFYLFNPCIFMDSSVWGQFDSIHCFFILLVVVCLIQAIVSRSDRWWILAWVMWALAMGSKLQSIVIFPLLATLTFLRARPRTTMAAIAAGALTSLALYAPFLVAHRWDYLQCVWVRSFTRYGFTQMNAFNLWGLGFSAPSSIKLLGLISYARLGQLLYVASVFWLCWCVLRHTLGQTSPPSVSRSHAIAAAYAGVAPFMVLTGMHERYIAAALPFLVIAGCLDKRMRWLLVGFSLTYTLNVIFVLRSANATVEAMPIVNASNFAMRLFGALLNVAMFGWFTARLSYLLATGDQPGVAGELRAA